MSDELTLKSISAYNGNLHNGMTAALEAVVAIILDRTGGAHMTRAELIAAAIQHVKDVGPNSYEEWVGLIIDFTCNACALGPTHRPDEHNLETTSPVPGSCVWPETEEQT